MATIPAEVSGPGDEELIDSVRHGSTSAFGDLYERHVGAAYNLARQLARSAAESDDLVADAFAKVLDTLRAGKGPDVAFRAYLLTTLRHTAYDKTRKDRKVELSEDVTAISGVSSEKVSVPFSDTAVEGLERSLAARAFATLPERWQAVLWHTEIEGQPPAEVAPLLGISANGVSALAYRAREGLRQAYLQVHLAETGTQRCRSTVDRLGAWTRGGLAKREKAQVEAHLDECDRCRALAAELADVNGALRAILAPVVLGVAAGGYLAAAGGSGKLAAAGAGAAASGSASGAAGAASSAPRQFLGVGASATALAAAIAVGSVANTGSQQVPTAQVAPQTPSRTAPASPQPPGTQQPPAQQPNNPQQPPASPPSDTPDTPEGPGPTSTPQQPPDGKPTLTASGPSVTLQPGGGAQRLPLTVRNTGDAPSGPVTATVRLPDGVSAVGANTTHRRVQPKAYTTYLAAGQGSRQKRCPGGTGTVTCTSDSGLAPGESVTLVYELKADDSVTSDTSITGSVSSASGGISVDVNVPVQVEQPEDGVEVDAHGSPVWFHVTATDDGDTTEPVTVTLDTVAHPYPRLRGDFRCHHTSSNTTCTSKDELTPGESEGLKLWLYPPYADGTVTVTATLGDASTSRTVHLNWGSKRHGPSPVPAGPPVAPPTVTHGPKPN